MKWLIIFYAMAMSIIITGCVKDNPYKNFEKEKKCNINYSLIHLYNDTWEITIFKFTNNHKRILTKYLNFRT